MSASALLNPHRADAKPAAIYRMVMPGHTCPYGLKALHLLKSRGFEVTDNWLTSRAETDAFKAQHNVATTPQIFIDGQRIGGYDDLRRHFGLRVETPDAVSYVPVLAVFATALTIAAAISWAAFGGLVAERVLPWFVSISMLLLAMLKLQDLTRFATMFLNYDLLARRWVPYAKIYPFAEFLAGAMMTAGVFSWISVPVALVIGSIGAVSVIRAVYIEKRDLKCACVGGSSRVPLGFVSLAENLAMVAMALWMIVSH